MAFLSMRATTQQSQVMSPRLQHAVRLLQMSSQDFEQTVTDCLGSNPFLEQDDEGSLLQGGLAALVAPAAAGAALHAEPSASAPEPAGGPELPEPAAPADGDAWDLGSPASPSRGERDDLSACDFLVEAPTLNAHLHGQLNLLPLGARDMALAKAVVESLDDDGYLRSDPAELAAWTGLDEPASGEEIRIAVCRVQSLDPAGVGARTVQECLALQAREVPCAAQRALIEAIVGEHLKLLASRDVEALARATGRPAAEVAAACARIRRFEPRPGWRHNAPPVQYVTPDVIARRVRGRWVAQLNPEVVPRVRLDRTMATLFRHDAGGASPAMASHLQEARWTLRNVEQRFTTIVGVAQAILDRQHHFLDYGEMAMKPLGLSEIAEAVGAHESTVSRATSNKYLATPAGVFELKHFFSRAMVMPNGNHCSSIAIRGLLRDLIAEEPPDHPLSDTALMTLLARQGLNVARRTVTKYRQSLKIQPAAQRRAAA
ncbi:RNA polymerase factor sigma-54 [Aquincola sp. MAHUQ-54]|uniref:RNA polymerase sigma-54 factor n=1 Tax=Aquincola agrisoli TaxID=3119538 RepID=A0AAW9QK14_9BURK